MVELGLITPELVQPEWADHVTAPAVDALRPEQLTTLAASEPWSFLHVTGVDATGPSDDPACHGAAAHLQRLRAAGAYTPLPEPGLVVYRLAAGDHARLGVIADLDLADCDAGRLRRHEHTSPAKVRALQRHRAAVGVDAAPISVAYSGRGRLDRRLVELATAPPAVSATTADGARHELWPVTDPDAVAEILAEIAVLDAVYVLDGHHRLAAAAGHAEALLASSGAAGDAGRILAVLFPAEHVQPLDYRRVLHRPPGEPTAALLDAVRQRFDVAPVATAEQAQPPRRGEMGLRLDGEWYRLTPHPRLVPAQIPDRLDEAVVQRHLLQAVLGAGDARDESRLSYVPGTVALSDLERRVDPSDAVVVLHPLPLAELQAVADAGAVLPPKSTYITPKVAAGLLLQRREAPVPAAL